MTNTFFLPTQVFSILFVIFFCFHLTSAQEFSGKVVAITDGDTFKILRQGKAVKVRIYGIDSPEKKQAFGNKAQKFLSNLIFEKEIKVEVLKKDQYQRILGKVYTQKGVYVNEYMVKNGMAWWYQKYAKNEKDLENAQIHARKNKIGLWSDLHPTPPWQWRKSQQKK